MIITILQRTASGLTTAAPHIFALILLCNGAGIATVNAAESNTAGDALRARHGALQDRLNNNPFQRPLALDSGEAADRVTGSVYAIISHPFITVSTTLNNPDRWCDVLILHLNTKYCRSAKAGGVSVINLNVGEKHDQALDETYRMDLAYRVSVRTPEYLQILFSADEGPLSTSNYRLAFEAIPLDNGQTFIHLSYAYTYGLLGRLAMQAYLGTAGRDKVGFTQSGVQSDGQPQHISDMRGSIERNTMRYYLAIEAFLGALSQPLPAQFEKRLNDWFTATELYPRQLHEIERNTYLEMKRREYRRQQIAMAARGAERRLLLP